MLAGAYLEALDEARENDQQDERRAQPDHQRGGQRGESSPGGIREQADSDQDHEHGHDPVGGDASGHIGVADAIDEAPLAQQQLVEVEPVVDSQQRGEGRRQDGKMADGPCREQQVLESRSRRIEARDDQDHQDHDSQQPAPDESVEGEGKDVERDILVPDRILDVERFLVEEGQDGLPLPRGDPAEEEAEQEDPQQGEDGRRRAYQPLADADR